MAPNKSEAKDRRCTLSKKRSLESNEPLVSSSPQKRLKAVVAEVQASKCIDYLFKLDEHATLLGSGDLKELQLDLVMCKDCLELLNTVMVKAKKMENEKRPSSSESASQTDQEMAEQGSDISSSADSRTNVDTSGQARTRRKALIQEVYDSTGQDCNCRFVGWRK